MFARKRTPRRSSGSKVGGRTVIGGYRRPLWRSGGAHHRNPGPNPLVVAPVIGTLEGRMTPRPLSGSFRSYNTRTPGNGETARCSSPRHRFRKSCYGSPGEASPAIGCVEEVAAFGPRGITLGSGELSLGPIARTRPDRIPHAGGACPCDTSGVSGSASRPFPPSWRDADAAPARPARTVPKATTSAARSHEEREALSIEETIKVAVADDQRLFARGISGIVDEQPNMEIVGVAHDGEEAVALCRKEEPDVVLMDVHMPKMDGISATRELRDLLPNSAVLILTSSDEDEHVFEGIKAGALGYLLKDCTPEELARAIGTVHSGQTVMAPGIARKMLGTFGGSNAAPARAGSGARLAPPLTERELEVVKALARGKTDRQIARELGISEKTVGNHASNVYRKLHVFDRTQAVIYAVREGLVDVADLEYRPPPGEPRQP